MIIVPTCLHFEAANRCFFGKFTHSNNNKNPPKKRKKEKGIKKKKEKVVQSVQRFWKQMCKITI